MGKNLHGGSKHKRKKNSSGPKKRDLPFAEEGCDYAKVTKMLGNKRLLALCYHDGKERLCKIRNKIKRNQWIHVDDIVLIGLRDFQDSKADVKHLYTKTQALYLSRKGVLPADVDIFGMNAATEDYDDEEGLFSTGKPESPDEENVNEEVVEEELEDDDDDEIDDLFD